MHAPGARTHLAEPDTRPTPVSASSSPHSPRATAHPDPAPRWSDRFFSPRAELIGSILTGALLSLGWGIRAAAATPDSPSASIGGSLIWASLAFGMVYGGRAAVESLRERKFDIDVLMVVAAALAAYIDAPAEGALLLFLFTLSGSLEGLALARTARAVEALHRLMPTTAQRWDGAAWADVDPATLAPGDRIKVRPGESIPVDAVLTLGASAIDQANLTGESEPRDAAEGDEVYAGTINVGNPFEARVTRPASESSLQRVLDLVLKAQGQREPVQRLLDRLSQPYALTVLGVSTLVLLAWRLAFSEPWADALYTAITLLIVMSPCAVIIATPTATLCAIARGARAGVLFKGGQSIERLARVRAVCLDKTGTLTLGRPRVQQVHPVAWSDGRALLAIAAALETDSTHPIAGAVRAAASARGVRPAGAVLGAESFPGRGVGGTVAGRAARLGSFEHTADLIPVCLRSRIREVLDRVQGRGQIGVVIAAAPAAPALPAGGNEAGDARDASAGEAAVLVIMDELRPGAPGLVAGLHALGVRPVVMLTGDNARTAERVAAELGIDRWSAGLLPEDKVEAVQALKAELRGGGHRARSGVGVIGDGVNDAPALTAADVSIAIGSIGSDAALESADIVLLGEDLSPIPWALRLARRTRRTITINLSFALGAIALMAVVTLIGSRLGFRLPLWAGVLGHEGGTLLVVLNSLFLLVFRGVTGPHTGEPDQDGMGDAALPLE